MPSWTTIQQIGVEKMLEITGRANHFGRRVAREEWIWKKRINAGGKTPKCVSQKGWERNGRRRKQTREKHC